MGSNPWQGVLGKDTGSAPRMGEILHVLYRYHNVGGESNCMYILRGRGEIHIIKPLHFARAATFNHSLWLRPIALAGLKYAKRCKLSIVDQMPI